jgi:BirA family transcriptional regulator, biotin operon repressor / biotin---[acetyl-CoA-carboxylase] ligase
LSRPDSIEFAQSLPEDIAAYVTAAADRLDPFSYGIRWYPVLPSTNDALAQMADVGAPQGCVVGTERQTAGRGRHGRSWCSPPGAGLYISVLLRPALASMPLLTIAAGVALADGVTASTQLRPALKWPNDVYVHRRKLAGILSEASSSGSSVQYVVLGFGINVSECAYSPEVAQRATSLEAELGRPIDRGPVLVECLSALAARYDDLEHHRAGRIVSAWREYAKPMLGASVEWDGPSGAERGIAEDVDESGALVVNTASGSARVISGEVRWI